MFYGAPMPLLVEATFIPFRDVIISDGLVMPYKTMMGSSIKQMCKDIYDCKEYWSDSSVALNWFRSRRELRKDDWDAG